MFPVSIDGEIEIPALGSEKDRILGILGNIQHALVDEKAENLNLIGNRLSFDAGLFRMVRNTNVLVPIGYGEIEVFPGNPGRVKYELSCKQLLTCTSIGACLMGAFVGLGARESSYSGAFAIAMITWSGLFGLNYFIALFRVRKFIRRAVEN